jgi:hypothetical protein
MHETHGRTWGRRGTARGPRSMLALVGLLAACATGGGGPGGEASGGIAGTQGDELLVTRERPRGARLTEALQALLRYFEPEEQQQLRDLVAALAAGQEKAVARGRSHFCALAAEDERAQRAARQVCRWLEVEQPGREQGEWQASIAPRVLAAAATLRPSPWRDRSAPLNADQCRQLKAQLAEAARACVALDCPWTIGAAARSETVCRGYGVLDEGIFRLTRSAYQASKAWLARCLSTVDGSRRCLAPRFDRAFSLGLDGVPGARIAARARFQSWSEYAELLEQGQRTMAALLPLYEGLEPMLRRELATLKQQELARRGECEQALQATAPLTGQDEKVMVSHQCSPRTLSRASLAALADLAQKRTAREAADREERERREARRRIGRAVQPPPRKSDDPPAPPKDPRQAERCRLACRSYSVCLTSCGQAADQSTSSTAELNACVARCGPRKTAECARCPGES